MSKQLSILLRFSGLYDPELSELKQKLRESTELRVFTEGQHSRRSFDAAAVSLAIDGAALLISSVALFYQLRDRRGNEPRAALVREASDEAEKRSQLFLSETDRRQLAELESEPDSGVIVHGGIEISYFFANSVLEVEADLREEGSEL